jgi:hypothetical protein
VQPIGAVGSDTDRDAAGRFVAGNQAALVTGEHSEAFWNAQEGARRAIEAACLSDKGHTVEDAPKALLFAVESISQAVLIRDAAFRRVVESGGPLTSKDRQRAAFTVWQAAVDRLERHLRLLTLERTARDVNDSIEAAIAAELKVTR